MSVKCTKPSMLTRREAAAMLGKNESRSVAGTLRGRFKAQRHPINDYRMDGQI